jgi:hypothetical protein
MRIAVTGISSALRDAIQQADLKTTSGRIYPIEREPEPMLTMPSIGSLNSLLYSHTPIQDAAQNLMKGKYRTKGKKSVSQRARSRRRK